MNADAAVMSQGSTVTIDCDFHFPRFAAAYLIYSGKQAAFIDNNTRHCVPKLLTTLGEHGLTPADVKYVIITHVHLDHAGGTADLMAACPNATLIAHPKAARHMIDPARLIAGVRQVYGDAVYDKVYGEFAAVDAARVRTMEDYETLQLGGRTLQFIHTRGHANHHFCIFDQSTGEIFTGDAFGIRYPELQKNGKLFIYPTTSPTQYDGMLAIEAVDKILATGATRAYPTHFGAIDAVAAAAAILKKDLMQCEEIVETARLKGDEGAIHKFCQSEVRQWLRGKLDANGQSFDAQAQVLLELDINLNSAGLAHAAITRNNPENT